MRRTPFDPETEYELLRSETPHTVDGLWPGEPTGEVACRECGAVAMNVDEIPHESDCSQRFARSEWWTNHLLE